MEVKPQWKRLRLVGSIFYLKRLNLFWAVSLLILEVMKIIFKFLPILLIAVCAGCSAQKTAVKSDRSVASEVSHDQAIKALEERRFVVEADEFFLPESRQTVKLASGSYISMQGNKGVIRLSRSVFPRETWRRLNIEDDAAEITEMEPKKNGDRQFFIKIIGPHKGSEREIVLTLYKDTNKCLARVNYYRSSHLFDFTGYVYPAGE